MYYRPVVRRVSRCVIFCHFVAVCWIYVSACICIGLYTKRNQTKGNLTNRYQPLPTVTNTSDHFKSIEIFFVRLLHSSHSIWVKQIRTDSNIYRWIQSLVKSTNQEPYYPYEPSDRMEVVVVKIRLEWYRCLFLESTSAEEVRVFAIDYGVELTAKKGNIRVKDKIKIHKSLLENLYCKIFCKIIKLLNQI